MLLNSTILFTLFPSYHIFSSRVSSHLFMLISSLMYSSDDHINGVDVGLYRSLLSWISSLLPSMFVPKTSDLFKVASISLKFYVCFTLEWGTLLDKLFIFGRIIASFFLCGCLNLQICLCFKIPLYCFAFTKTSLSSMLPTSFCKKSAIKEPHALAKSSTVTAGWWREDPLENWGLCFQPELKISWWTWFSDDNGNGPFNWYCESPMYHVPFPVNV